MKIILLEDIKGIGKRFEEKEVSDGYAINFLVPKKLAVSFSGSSAASIKILKEQEERLREKKKQALDDNIAKVAGTTVTTKMKANEKNHLFASLSAEKISALLKKEGIEIAPEHIRLSEPIKAIGTFEVPIAVGEGKEVKFTLEIIRA